MRQLHQYHAGDTNRVGGQSESERRAEIEEVSKILFLSFCESCPGLNGGKEERR